MQFNTTHLEEYDLPEFEIQYDPERIPQEYVTWLAGHLSDLALQGENLDPGCTVQIGWSRLTLDERNGRMILLENDFTDPDRIELKESVTQTLMHLQLQSDTFDSFNLPGGLEIDFPNLTDEIIITPGYEELRNLALLREDKEKGFSGWWIRDLRTVEEPLQDSGLEKIPLYHLACKRKDLIAYMALPVGCGIPIAEGHNIHLVYQAQSYNALPKSFVDELNRAAQLARHIS